MSYLRILVKVVVLAGLSLGFAACESDGGFNAATRAGLKDAGATDETPQQALPPEEVKALADSKSQQIDELEEEIAMKDEALKKQEQDLNDLENQIKSVSEQLAVLSLESSQSASLDPQVSEKLKTLGAEVAALKEGFYKDREAYAQAIEEVTKRDRELVDSLSEVIHELNRLKKQNQDSEDKMDEQTLSELEDIEALYKERIQSKLELERQESLELASQIANLEAHLNELMEKKRLLEEKENLNETQEIQRTSEVNQISEEIINFEDERNLKLAEEAANKRNIQVLECALNADTCLPPPPMVNNEGENPVDEGDKAQSEDQQEEETEVKNSQATILDEESAADAKVTEESLRQSLEGLDLGAQIFTAEDTIKTLKSELKDLESLKKESELRVQEINNELLALQSQLSQDHALFMEARKPLVEEKSSLLKTISQVQANISTIQNEEIPMVEDEVLRLKAIQVTGGQ